MTEQTQPQGIDLGTLTSVDPSEITHRVGIAFDDDGEPTAGFVVVGSDSKQYRDALERQRIAGIRRQAAKSPRINGKSEEGAA